MSYSTSACVHVAVSNPRRSSRKSISPGFFGCAAVGGLVLVCVWTVYANVIRADVYPTLGIANYDAPVIRSAALVVRKSPPTENALRTSEMAPSAPSLSFNDRFAAAAPQSVEPKPQPQAIVETSKPQVEAPKLATAPKAKEAAPVQVAAVPASPQRAVEARPATSTGSALRDMAQRAKAAVIALATSEKQTIVEKLWGKQQPSHGPLLAFASADASVTGSLGGGIGQNQNPALGGSAPYDRSTAVYDISARTVYLPDGTQLEAHSGLGSRLDDPRSAHVKMHGVTPPHIYELKPREALFHGVLALRMTPIGGEEAIFGRSGLLAHSFMLGPNGDSNGCVSFRDYDAFLNAYRNQGIKRLAVVAKVE
ncbi:MAG: tlde1 domain-containing protein [Bradyrhizobium sp.]